MHIYITVLGKQIPTYGLMITLGLIIANWLAYVKKKKSDLSYDNVWTLEGYLLLGGVIGAKVLYLWTIRDVIEWNRFFDLDYFNKLMQGGFVFYGGLLGAILALFIAEKLHHLNTGAYVSELIFLAPFVHGFGRIGCHLAGCCYGIPYEGFLSVVFPENSLAPHGIPLLPIQAIESALLFGLSAVMYRNSFSRNQSRAVLVYLLGYSAIRFILEFFRDDSERGSWLFFTTSQWISVLLVVSVYLWYLYKKSRAARNYC